MRPKSAHAASRTVEGTFDTVAVGETTKTLQLALINADRTATTITTRDLAKVIITPGMRVIEAVTAGDAEELKENVLHFLNATDALIGSFEDNPLQVDAYRLGSQNVQLYLVLRYGYESAECDFRYLDAAVSAEMAAHTLSRIRKLRDSIKQQVDAGLVKVDLAFLTLESVLEEGSRSTLILDNGEEISDSEGARREFLERAGVNYTKAAQEIQVDTQNPTGSRDEALNLTALAAVVLKEAGVSHTIRLAVVGDCRALAQAIARGTSEGIVPDFEDKVREIRDVAIENAKARYHEFDFAPMSVDGLLRN